MHTRTTGVDAAMISLGAGLILTPAASATTEIDSTTAPSIVAEDASGVVIARDETFRLRAVPSVSRAITVTTRPGARVTITAKGTKPKTALANETGTATFTRLKAGKIHTVRADKQRVRVVPVLHVGRAFDLTVMTTADIDTVDLTWSHKVTKARGGDDITYTVTAISEQDSEAITVNTTEPRAALTGLDPRALYSFAVTPRNALGDGKSSTARMSRSLIDITGLPAPTVDDAPDTGSGHAESVATPEPAPAPAPAPRPVPASAPTPVQAPAFRTIWVCPEGFTDVDDTCTQSREYTFTETTETSPYTYSQTFHQTGWQNGSFTPSPCSYGTYHSNGPQGEGCYVAAGPTGYYTTGKDAPPTGWTDDGEQYTKTVRIKDSTPDGFTDNDTEWVRTTDKVAQVVPA